MLLKKPRNNQLLKKEDATIRVNLWSSPRNISTALMYSFAQNPEVTVVDEPLYASYLYRQNPRIDHPGRDLILKSQPTDPGTVIRDVLYGTYSTRAVVFKQMSHHLYGMNLDFMAGMKHVLLIRHPAEILASYEKVIANPGLEDVGIEFQVRLYKHLEKSNLAPIVLDTNELLKNPGLILEKLCQKLDIQFFPGMLRWQAGARPEDGVWAPFWYSNVHQSTGFIPYQKRSPVLTPLLQELAEKALPFYYFLLEKSLRPD